MPHDENQGSRLSLLLFYFLAFYCYGNGSGRCTILRIQNIPVFHHFYRFGISAVILPDEVVRHRAVLHSVYVDQYSYAVL